MTFRFHLESVGQNKSCSAQPLDVHLEAVRVVMI